MAMIWWNLTLTFSLNDPIGTVDWEYGNLSGSTATASVANTFTALLFALRNLYNALLHPDHFVVISSRACTKKVSLKDLADGPSWAHSSTTASRSWVSRNGSSASRSRGSLSSNGSVDAHATDSFDEPRQDGTFQKDFDPQNSNHKWRISEKEAFQIGGRRPDKPAEPKCGGLSKSSSTLSKLSSMDSRVLIEDAQQSGILLCGGLSGTGKRGSLDSVGTGSRLVDDQSAQHLKRDDTAPSQLSVCVEEDVLGSVQRSSNCSTPASQADSYKVGFAATGSQRWTMDLVADESQLPRPPELGVFMSQPRQAAAV